MKDLTKGNITKLLFAFAIPVLIGCILQLTYSLVDTRIVGSALGESALAAVGATSSLSSLLIGFLQGLTNGFAVIAAQFFGAQDFKGLKRCVAASLSLGCAIAIFITAAALIFLHPLLMLLNTPADVIDLSGDYISIIFAGLIISNAKLLADDASLGKKVIAEAKPYFKSKEEYLAAIDAITMDKDAVVYNEDGTITLSFTK